MCVAINVCGVPTLISETVVNQFATLFNKARSLNQNQSSLIDMASLPSQLAMGAPISAFIGWNY